MKPLLAELEQRFHAMFAALAAGDDLPPAQRLRTEGMLEAALLSGAAGVAELDQLMDGCYRQCFGCGLADEFGNDWRSFFPFPQIPAMARRAPVYPSTRD